MHISSISSWALIIWKTLAQEGFDPSVVFKQANADIQKLSDPEARYDLATMHSLWAAIAERTNDPEIGARIGQNWDVTSFHALGFAWLASSNLREAFERFNRYAAVVNNGLISEVANHGSLIGLRLTSHADPALIHPLATDAGVSALVKMCKMLVGNHFLPVSLDLKREATAPSLITHQFVNNVSYNASHNAIWVDSRTADKTLLSGNDTLAITNEQLAHDYLERLLKGDIEHSAFNLIIHQLPNGDVNENWLADKLHMSVRTLRRKLQSNQTSFRDLMNEVRKEVALRYIKEPNISCIEIGFLLGFSDQANFTRAFKRWYGKTPTEYRAHIIETRKTAITQNY